MISKKFIKMIKKTIICVCICLVAVIILPQNKVSASTGNGNSYETKTYYNGSINDDFGDDKIIVVLTKEETRKNLE